MQFFVSFARNHRQEFNGVSIDENCLVIIHGDNQEEAEQKAWSLFGRKWSMLYDYDRAMSTEFWTYFPRRVAVCSSCGRWSDVTASKEDGSMVCVHCKT